MSQSLLSWEFAPTRPQLQNNEVHIWRADLNVSEIILQQLSNHLSSDEQIRAARFVHEQDRTYYAAARGILRDILSRYSNIAPQQIEFNYSEKGKPSLNSDSLQPMIFFNLSHTHGVVLYAISNLRNIGIDIELIRSNIDALSIAERFFSKDEISLLQDLPLSDQLMGFYKIWTRKEAYVKAIGEGISHPLDQFSVNLLKHKTKIKFNQPKQTVSDWYIYDIVIDQQYCAAVALSLDNAIIHHWHW